MHQRDPHPLSSFFFPDPKGPMMRDHEESAVPESAVPERASVVVDRSEERIVVTREVVPVERVTLQTSVVTEERVIEAGVRRERVEVTEQPAR